MAVSPSFVLKVAGANMKVASTGPNKEPLESTGVAAAVNAGLCTNCQRARRIVSAKGSSFWLCERGATETERFQKYPRLPVLRCAGFEQIER
jgi:hypothetical protein